MTKELKTINKSLIFLKATTIALGIVLVVSVIGLVIAKSSKDRTNTKEVSQEDCQKSVEFKVENDVKEVISQRNSIIIVTKPNSKTKTQEIITIDKSCSNISNYIKLKF